MGLFKSIFKFVNISNRTSKEVGKELEKGLDDFSDFMEYCKIEQTIRHEKEINELKDQMKHDVDKYNRENNTNFQDHDELNAHLKASTDEKLKLIKQLEDLTF